jgi:hypothetical protein
VSRFSGYSYYYSYYNVGNVQNTNEDKTKSDTLRLVEDKDFQEIILKRNFGKLQDYLSDVGFWGVMFLTSPDEIIGFSRNKGLHVILKDNILIFSNTDLSKELDNKELSFFGFNFSRGLPQKVFYDKLLVFNALSGKLANVVNIAPKYKYAWKYGNSSYGILDNDENKDSEEKEWKYWTNYYRGSWEY